MTTQEILSDPGFAEVVKKAMSHPGVAEAMAIYEQWAELDAYGRYYEAAVYAPGSVVLSTSSSPASSLPVLNADLE